MAIKKEFTYICIRECFTFNKHFMPGDGFPMDWISRGYKPNKHFSLKATAFDAMEEAKRERAVYGHGDDKRSTAELKTTLSKFMEFPDSWTRKQIWLEVRRHEAAEQRDIRKPGRPPKKV